MNRSEQRVAKCEHSFASETQRCEHCGLYAGSPTGVAWLIKTCNQLDRALSRYSVEFNSLQSNSELLRKNVEDWQRAYKEEEAKCLGFKLAFRLSAALLLFMLVLYILTGTGVF
jgi:hypothetical protein